MHFIDTDVPIYVHDQELYTALWSLFTKVHYLLFTARSRPLTFQQADRGPYHASYLTHRLNWQTFDGKVNEIFEGISMHHCPGYVRRYQLESVTDDTRHTAGLCCMQVDLQDSGTFVFTSDQFHVKENHTKRQPQGTCISRRYSGGQDRLTLDLGLLGRDRTTWFQSTTYLERVERVLKAKLVYGHDMGTFMSLKQIPEHYQ